MIKLFAYTALVLTSLLPVAHSAEAVDKQLTVDAKPNVKIKVQRGTLELIAWDKSEIKVTGQLDELTEGLIFEKQGQHIIIEDKLPRSYQGNNSQGSQLKIYLPNTLELHGEGVSSDISAASFTGDVYLSGVSSDIKLVQSQGNISLKTVSGEITTEQLQGQLSFESVSGNIKNRQSQGQAKVRIVSGDIELESDFTQVEIDQVSGEIEAKLPKIQTMNLVAISGDSELLLGGSLNQGSFESISGDIEMKFITQPNVAFDIDGGPSGDIKNTLTADKPVKQKYMPGKKLKFSSLQGNGSISINTISGDISVANK